MHGLQAFRSRAGIYSAIFTAIIVAVFGSSRHLIVGPSNAIAILIQGGISDVLFTFYRNATGPEKEELVLQILTQLMLLVGVIQILAAFLKLGRLTHFVSHTVIIAYVSGVALALVINQLFPSFRHGCSDRCLFPLRAKRLYPDPFPSRPLADGNHRHFVFCLLLGLRRIDRKMPAGAMMLAIVAFFAYFLGFFTIIYQAQ